VRLSIKMMMAFLCGAALLLALVAADVAHKSTVCGDANEALSHAELTRADAAFDKALANDPNSHCALKGKRAVALKRCTDAGDEEGLKLTEEARKAYAALLSREPDHGRFCALGGLIRTAPKDDDTATTPASTTPEKATPVTVVVHVDNGGGRTTSTTKTVIREYRSKIVIYCDVRRVKKCRMMG
jgi:N-acetylglucosamine kinase-like BadF-type ATPase